MKSIAITALALVCVIGLVAAQGYYNPYGTASSGGLGNGGLLALIGLLVLLMALFGTSSSGSGSTTFIYGNFSGPTGGK